MERNQRWFFLIIFICFNLCFFEFWFLEEKSEGLIISFLLESKIIIKIGFYQNCPFRVDFKMSLKSLYEIIPFKSELLFIEILEVSNLMFEALSCTAYLNFFESSMFPLLNYLTVTSFCAIFSSFFVNFPFPFFNSTIFTDS